MNIELKVARIRCGYTQKEMAHMLGVEQSNYSRWERGVHEPIDVYKAKIGEILGCSPKRFWKD